MEQTIAQLTKGVEDLGAVWVTEVKSLGAGAMAIQGYTCTAPGYSGSPHVRQFNTGESGGEGDQEKSPSVYSFYHLGAHRWRRLHPAPEALNDLELPIRGFAVTYTIRNTIVLGVLPHHRAGGVIPDNLSNAESIDPDRSRDQEN